MLGGLGGLNPKKMQEMMKQLGIKQQEIDAERVIIEKRDGKRLVIEEPTVVKINMQGTETLQISGGIAEEENEGISEEDVKIVAEKTRKSEEEARKALEEANGDLAEAITKLQ